MLKKDNVEMRGLKKEERLRSPMFPRLNVSDAEKPGQKAPPRNKMAVYEQLALPSLKFGSGNSESSGHAGTFERSVFTSFRNTLGPSHSENSFTPYSGGVELRTKKSSEEQKAINFPDDRSSVKSHNSKLKRFEDDTRAMRSAQSGLAMHHNKDRENKPYCNLSFSMQCKDTFKKQKGEIGIANLQERRSMSNQTVESRKISNARQNPVLSTESLKGAHPIFNQANGTCGTNTLKRLHCANDRSNQDTVPVEKTENIQDEPLLEYAGGIGKNDACKVTYDSVVKSSPKVEKRSRNLSIESDNKNPEGQKNESLQIVDLQRHALTPDDVVKVFGEKQFWKARKAMVDQQRTFRLQVFELHRLLKVQKLIAQSPDLLLEDNIYSRKTLSKSSKVQKPVCIETYRELTQQANPESPWWVPAPRNQWLVPVISPSEGLVYKPYTAPCHPNTGYMSAVCGPPGLTSGRGNFLNAVYGVPASQQQGIMGYVMPVMTSGSTVDQGSCNMSSQISQTVKYSVGNFQVSKETEIQGSAKEYTLPLFPTEPTSRSTDHKAQTNEKLTRVIKVAPHNRKLATESAARIFQSIAEERKQRC